MSIAEKPSIDYRACLFCGSKPNKKNLEHILPLWLIRLTGDPNRKIKIGPIYPAGELSLAFDQLRYPSCSRCNSRYGYLEEKVKAVITDLLNDSPLNSDDFDILLDWLDKVRIGLWFYFRALNKELFHIKPNYHVHDRVACHDRSVFMFKMDCSRRGLTFTGAAMPTFYFLPSCFGLKIKHYFFINVSVNYFLHQRFGLRYPKRMKLRSDSTLRIKEFGKASCKIRTPLFDRFKTGACTEIHQLIFKYDFPNSLPREISDYQDALRSQDRNKGKIFYTKNNKTSFYGNEKSKNWIPDEILHPGKCFIDGFKEIGHIQCRFLSDRKTEVDSETKYIFQRACETTEIMIKEGSDYSEKTMEMERLQRLKDKSLSELCD